ncbi:hypothetical protein JOB18_039589, partial [Solea senegalensis]
MPTLLDPRFKKLGFENATRRQEAVNRLKNECANVIRHEASSAPPGQLQNTRVAQSGGNSELWWLLDDGINSSGSSSSVVADAMIEVDRYLAEMNISRDEDPL